MPKYKDIAGQRFGRLLALERLGSDKRGQSLWRCQCDCGNDKISRAGDLVYGQQSCGCARREKLIAQTTKHGQTRTPTWYSWIGMLERCDDPRSSSYKWYGARGIKVCARWWSFTNFLADMGERPEGMTLDRRENDGNYEKTNCRWATPKQQTDNRRPAQRQRKAVRSDRPTA